MNARALLALPLTLALAAAGFAAPPPVKVDWNGIFTRTQTARLEKVGDQQFIILGNADQIEENRLPVVETKMIQMMPPVQRISAKAGELVATVDIRSMVTDMGGASLTVELGDEAIRPIHLKPAPEITIEGRGYYNRSNYVRLETWKTKEGTKQYIVLNSFGSPQETRLPVTSATGQASSTTTKEYRAEAKGKKVTLQFGDGRLARVQIDGGEFRPLVLLDS
jgi:hypothetical protein